MRWGPALVVMLLGLAGCSGSAAAPEPSCPPGLAQGGRAYRLVETTPAGLDPGEPVADASYLGCDDGSGPRGGGPVDAWRAAGLGAGYLVTLTACAQAEGSSAAADCDPAADRYLLWRLEEPSGAAG